MVSTPGPVEDLYSWTETYKAFADGLLRYKDDRATLIEKIEELREEGHTVPALEDRFSDGSKGLVEDIDPFTVFAIFNRGTGEDKRKRAIKELSEKLGIAVPTPHDFDGLPTVYPGRSWFFGYDKVRASDDIDNLWELFEAALVLADDENEESLYRFEEAYDLVRRQRAIKWNISMGLYWVRPDTFLNLDGLNRDNLGELGFSMPKYKAPDAEEYWELTKEVRKALGTLDLNVASLPELSHRSWKRAQAEANGPGDDENGEGNGAPPSPPKGASYAVANIMDDGAFMPGEELQEMVDVLREKKNIVLQGPPGTGKTWLSNRLAYALLGEKDRDRVRALQFHPNMSYEDFVRGLRPVAGGEFELTDGPLLQIASQAAHNLGEAHVLVIEEINRGNPAQVFGEMLTLLEADKRNADSAVELTYAGENPEPFHLPPNLHLIGTMNVADRSLALVDVALRRRFAFFNLTPQLNDSWEHWVVKAGVGRGDARLIRDRMGELNNTLAEDPSLGPQYTVGHSFVTPTPNMKIADGKEWFLRIVRTEIEPLLEEYWFDNPKRASHAAAALIEGF